MKSLKHLTVATIIILFFGCTGKDGAPGPTGKSGANGTSGLTITAMSIPSSSWTFGSTDNWYYNTSVGIPNTDACMIYMEINNGSYAPLPFSSGFAQGDNLTYNYQTGYAIQFTYFNPKGQSISNVLNFNIVDIPPARIMRPYPNSTLNDRAHINTAVMKQYPNVNWNDWNQVRALAKTVKPIPLNN